MKIVLTVLCVLGVLINVLIFNYVYQLEKKNCKCSEDWRRDYIKYFALISIIAEPFFTYLNNRKIKKQILLQLIIFLLGFSYLIGSILYIYYLFTYSQQMIKDKCDCSEKWERDFIYYYIRVILALYAFILLCSIALFVKKMIK